MENSTLCWKIGTSFEDASYTILAWLNIISGILSVGSNLLVLTAIFSFPPLRKVSSFLIASLAVADLLVGLLMNPIYTSIFIIKVFEDHQHPLRVAEHWLWLQTVITSTFTLTAVSIDRFIAVKKCLRYSEIAFLFMRVINMVFFFLVCFPAPCHPPRWGSTVVVDLYNSFNSVSTFLCHLVLLRSHLPSRANAMCSHSVRERYQFTLLQGSLEKQEGSLDFVYRNWPVRVAMVAKSRPLAVARFNGRSLWDAVYRLSVVLGGLPVIHQFVL